MNDLTILNLGNHNANKRVWIANQNILKSGFSVGDSVTHDFDPVSNQITINKHEYGDRVISGRSPSQPIIDIKNTKVAETLGNPEKIEVRFYDNRIVISIAKCESKRNERFEKTGKRMFELFVGGGTLHHQFKKAGFSSAGGLEMSDKYMAVFSQNNPEKDVVTICSAIEDVDPSDYPNDIDLMVCGIPCTVFSQGNLKMVEELAKLKNGGVADPEVIAKRYEAEALVFHVLNAIQAMNPRQVVVEEVAQFAETPASMMLRTVLAQWGYNLSETVAKAKHTKRQRWCLVADMTRKVSLDNLIEDDGKTLDDFLETPVGQRNWLRIDESKRFTKASETVGLRSHTPNEVKTNTFTTHSTRSTEPCLKHPTEELYSEFTNAEIANIHGLKGFELSGVKTIDRQILGQGVACMFEEVALRVSDSGSEQIEPAFISAGPTQLNIFSA